MRLTRRSLLQTGAVPLLTPLLGRLGLTVPALADERQWRYGLSLFGALKYPEGFKHFDYVNPAAPKAGTVRMIAFGTFDNFNVAVAGLKGSIAMGTNMLCDSLMVSSLDEVSTDYGLIAEAVSHPADFASTTFRLRPGARHHDGKPVTVDDVIFSMESFKKHNPMYSAYYRHVKKIEQTGEAEVTFTFDSTGNREMPVILGQLEVLPKHWWEGTDAAGKKRDIGLDHARAAARQRRVQDQGVRRRPHHRVRAREGLLGQGSQRQRRSRQFRRDPLRIFPRRDGRDRGLQGRSCRLAHREQRQELGDGLRFPRGEGEAGHPRGIPRAQPRHHAGVRVQHPARQVQGCAAAARVQSGLRLRGNEQADVLRPVQAHQQLLRGHRACLLGAAGRAGTGDPRNRARQGAARGVHHALQQPGRRFAREGAGQPARGDAPAARGRLRGAQPEARQRQDRRGHVASKSSPRIRPSSASSCSTSPRSNGSASP